MKYYKYIPIVKKSDVPDITNVGSDLALSIERHRSRLMNSLTDFICELAAVSPSKEQRDLFLKYDIKLVEDDLDGSRTISASFPEKRFY